MTPLEIVSQYRPVLHLQSDAVDVELVERLIDRVRGVPTALNLQPTHFSVVTESALKERMARACLQQSLVREAPVLVVFSASRYVVAQQFEEVIDLGLEHGTLSIERAESLDNSCRMLFETRPLGLGWLAKGVLAPILRLFTALPRLACVHKRAWLTEQVMRQATALWFLVYAENLAAVWIDIYDEWRVKRALDIPWHHVVVSVMAIGHAVDRAPVQALLPIDRYLHTNSWE